MTRFDPARGADEQLKAHIKRYQGAEYLAAVTRADIARVLVKYHEFEARFAREALEEWGDFDEDRQRAREYARLQERRAGAYRPVTSISPHLLVAMTRTAACPTIRGRSGRAPRRRNVRTGSRHTRAPSGSRSDDPDPEDDRHVVLLARGGGA